MSNTLRPGSIGGLRIAKAAEQDPHFNMLVFGDVGVGKTRLAGSSDAVPEMRPVLYLDAEGGAFTLRNTYPNTDVVRVTDWGELQPIYEELRAGTTDYRTVVVDSLTELQEMNMAQVMARLGERDPDRYEKQGEEIASMLEWQINSKKVRTLIRAFRDLPMTVIFTALMKEDKDKLTGRTVKRPNLPGKLAAAVAGMFDIVTYMYMQQIPDPQDETKEIQGRLLLTEATDKVVAKDRSNKLPKPVMVFPTMADIYKYAVEGTQQ